VFDRQIFIAAATGILFLPNSSLILHQFDVDLDELTAEFLYSERIEHTGRVYLLTIYGVQLLWPILFHLGIPIMLLALLVSMNCTDSQNAA